MIDTKSKSFIDWTQVGVSTSHLRGLAQDFLRFTMHFFHPIQQSASHMYHSALPLSPMSSSLRAMILREKPQISDFYGCPNAWGAVIRTIKADSGSFTHMTTFSHTIAAVSGDDTVAIYDSVTGALRLSLSLGGPVQAIRGSPDGSTLFCAHKGSSITGWDIQTGGISHTLDMENRIEDIAICSKGRHIACGLFDGSIKIWDVANQSAVATSAGGSPVTDLCWLEPGEQLVVVRGESAEVWDFVARRVLRSFTIKGLTRGVVCTQKFNGFAVVITSNTGSTIAVVDLHTGTLITSKTSQEISCAAFSPITKEVVCGTTVPGLELFSVPAQSWRQFNHSATITSVSILLNGTAVAHVAGSGIQLLSLEEGHTPPQQSIISTLTVHTFDEGNIVAILPTSRDRITLLESATMSPLLTIPVRTFEIPTDRPPILCVSLKHRIAIFFVEVSGETRLKLWKFGGKAPVWTDEVPGLRLVGGISPSGSQLVALDGDGPDTAIWMWDTGNGRLKASQFVGRPWPGHPLEIKFESENQFYSHHDACRFSFVISGSSITCLKQLPLAEELQRYYDVDDSHEWVVDPSKKICWIPPGYIGSDPHSYCWARNALVMTGEDRVLRKFTFREPS